MKTVWRELLIASFLGAGFISMPFSVRSEISAGKYSVMKCQSGEFSKLGSMVMSKPADAGSWLAANNSNETDMIATSEGPIVLGTGPVHIALKTIARARTDQRRLASRILALAPNRHIYLVLKELNVVKQPGVLYRLYLDLPPDTKPSRNDPHYVGTLNFFNATESDSFGVSTTRNSRFFSYDITTTVRNLQARGLLCDQTTLTIFPSGTPAAEAAPKIGRIELVEQ